MNRSGVARSIGFRESAEQSPESDGALLLAISRKHQAAFGEAYDRHIHLVAWFARAWLPAALVDDALQATFLTLWDKADRVQLSGESLAPWLLGSVQTARSCPSTQGPASPTFRDPGRGYGPGQRGG